MQDSRVKALSTFAAHFGGQPDVCVGAPGRVNIIGEHTDYNEGFVLPCAIALRTVVAARKTSRARNAVISVVAADLGGEREEIVLDAPIVPVERGWANYVRGVVRELIVRGHVLGSAELVVSGDVPRGAGLSSSASLEVALGAALGALFGLSLSLTELARMGQAAENDFVGCRSGIMDQLVSARGVTGHALLIDCRTLDCRPVAVPSEAAVLVVDSRIERSLVDGAYNTRREQCEAAARYFGVAALRDVSLATFEAGRTGLDPVVARRARHVITENGRTLEAAAALARGDLTELGALMARSHESMREDFEITVPAIDGLVALIQEELGAHGGARMTGGGFGGCVVAVLPHGRIEQVRDAVAARYPARNGGRSAEVFVCRPAAGVGPMAI